MLVMILAAVKKHADEAVQHYYQTVHQSSLDQTVQESSVESDRQAVQHYQKRAAWQHRQEYYLKPWLGALQSQTRLQRTKS